MDNAARQFIFAAMNHDTDILIAGAGLNGMTLALALGQNGMDVILVDPRPPAADGEGAALFDGRSYALALASVRMLEALELWPGLADESQPILEITASDGRAGDGPSALSLHFDHAEIEEGPMGHMVEDRHLRPLLREALLRHPHVTLIEGASVIDQDLSAAGAAASLSDGRRLSARLLVGCDGRQSPTARRAGITRTGWSYGQTALVCALHHEIPHGGHAHQFFMPQGPLAILPLRGNRSSIVWTERDSTARAINALDDAGYMAALTPRFGDFLGALQLEGARFAYPLELSLANRLTGPRLVLVGDAAHAVHPLAGQGLNQGLRDIAALAEVLVTAARRGEDFAQAQVLERYARWRRFDIVTLALATDGFNRLFSNDNPIIRGLRDLGLGAVNALPGLRRGFIREAAGLTGSLPRLMQGRPI